MDHAEEAEECDALELPDAGEGIGHPRFHMHFIPTSSSWLNLVERWFRQITDKRIRRGTFQSVPELIDAITAYIDAHNENPNSFEWTAKAEDIIEKVRRAREVLNKIAIA